MYNYRFFHGNALARLVQEGGDITLRLVSGNNGYLVNNTAFIYLKHSTKRMSPWIFTFLPEHIEEIAKANKQIGKVYIVLICNDDGICCLGYDELAKIIFIGSTSKSKSVRIDRSAREKYGISGTDGTLEYKIGDTDFPRKLLR